MREFQEYWHKPIYKDWDVLFTSGSMDGCSKIFEMTLETGDPVMVQTPTYDGILNAVNLLLYYSFTIFFLSLSFFLFFSSFFMISITNLRLITLTNTKYLGILNNTVLIDFILLNCSTLFVFYSARTFNAGIHRNFARSGWYNSGKYKKNLRRKTRQW